MDVKLIILNDWFKFYNKNEKEPMFIIRKKENKNEIYNKKK